MMMNPKEIEERHQDLVRFIVKKLDAARAYEREVRAKKIMGTSDELGKLFGKVYLDRVITDAVERVKDWERVLDECNSHPELIPESVLSMPPSPISGFQTLYSACWGALGEKKDE